MRCSFLTCWMLQSIPQIAEPLFTALNVEIELVPVMNADHLKKRYERRNAAIGSPTLTSTRYTLGRQSPAHSESLRPSAFSRAMWACRRAVHVACRGGARSASVEMSRRHTIGSRSTDRSALRRLAIRQPGPIEKSFLLRCPLGMRSSSRLPSVHLWLRPVHPSACRRSTRPAHRSQRPPIDRLRSPRRMVGIP